MNKKDKKKKLPGLIEKQLIWKQKEPNHALNLYPQLHKTSSKFNADYQIKNQGIKREFQKI
jgi:hypothetical protein